MRPEVAIDRVRVDAWTVPTDAPESDGTFAWDSTTMVVARVDAGDRTGLGYTYGHVAAGKVISRTLAPLVCGRSALDPGALYADCVAELRNVGYPGVGAMAVSALDVALWDLKARLLDTSVTELLGVARDRLPVYGSGGFTSYDETRLCEQLGAWVEAGIPRVKMKVGTNPGQDAARVAAARRAIGDDAGLMVDANGAYEVKQALRLAREFAEEGVDWFEEPVSSDDLRGLRLLRDRGPAGLEISAGEYGWDRHYFARMLQAGAVDVLQADATRCGGYSGFLEAAAVAGAMHVPLSAHCAPALHAPVCASVRELRHLEYFHDHVRLEQMAFDGTPKLVDGALHLAPDRPGHGLSLRESDLARYKV